MVALLVEKITEEIDGEAILQTPNVTTTLSRKQSMLLLVALDDYEEASGSLYWDDGEARNVSENYFTHLFECFNVSMAFIYCE